MNDSHPASFACAIIATEQTKSNFVTRLFSKKADLEYQLHMARNLAAFGLKIVEQHREPIRMFPDFDEESQITRVPVNNQIELWLGSPVAYMMQDLLSLMEPSTTMPPPKLDALFIKQDKTLNRYEDLYVRNGKLGHGRVTCGYSKRSWSKHYRQEQWPLPLSRFMSVGLPQLHTELDADKALIERVYSGMYGKGRYGMAYHAAKESWVMARSLPDKSDDLASAACKMFQELNQNSYVKKGKPFPASEAPKSGRIFLRQSDLIYEVQQRAIAASLGFRFDQPILDQNLFKGDFNKYWVE